MEWLLRFFPRYILIRLSLIGKPFLKWWFHGERFIDPIDGSSYRKFLPYGYGGKMRSNALCPGTLSLERHRLLWLYLTRETNFLKDSLTVLHLAPEQVFYKKFKALKNWNYTTADLNSPLASVKADICNLPFQDEQFDLVFCNHVLEHIPDDQKAMSELFRVLKNGGMAFLQVPISQNQAETFEDDSITDPKERTRIFGQYDHVRIYGCDFFERLQNAGFQTKVVDYTRTISKQEINRFALLKGEWIIIGRKSLSTSSGFPI